MSHEKEQSDRLHMLYISTLGDNWRREIKLNIRADNLWWFVRLIEWGIKKRKEEFLKDTKSRPSEIAASLGTWYLHLKQLVDQVESILKPAEKK